MDSKIRVLFFAEGATLAHVVRPLALARGLDADRFDVTFCCPSSYQWLTRNLALNVIDLDCQAADIFARRLQRGAPLYDLATLQKYVEDDLDLIDSLKPQVIVGDFRLSLSVSARLRNVPYVSLCDVYWSPEFPLRPVLPVFGLTQFVPLRPAEWCFKAFAPLAFRWHALSMERLRAHYQMEPLGYDLRRCYTDADLRLFANFPLLFPDARVGANSDFIGPITWFPDSEIDPRAFDGEGPLIYINLGSSGSSAALDSIVASIETTKCRVLVATAGKRLPKLAVSSRVRVYDYLPGNVVCQHAQLVICNGGSPTTNQALSQGVPVLGIAHNMDQFLNMRAIVEFGAGILLRADRLSPPAIRGAIDALLNDSSFAERARDLVVSTRGVDGIEILSRHILAMTSVE